MIEVKTAELIGPALDWATAKASETKIDDSRGKELRIDIAPGFQSPWIPSVNWYQGGPLIDQFKIGFALYEEPMLYFAVTGVNALDVFGSARGETHLIAACRAIVVAKIGAIVSVPKELMQ